MLSLLHFENKQNLEKSKFLLTCSEEFLASGISRGYKRDTGFALLCFQEESLENVVLHKTENLGPFAWTEVLNGPDLISDRAGSTKPQDTSDPNYL